MKKVFTAVAAIAVLGLSLNAANAGTEMSGKDKQMTAAVAAPECNWTGFYIGGNAGVNFNEFDLSETLDSINQPTQDQGPVVFQDEAENGRDELEFIGGWQIGYNFQWKRWVFGIEGDFQGAGDVDRTFNGRARVITDTDETTGALGRELTTDWFASVRPRIGYTFGCIMLYVTGGVGFADTTLAVRDRAFNDGVGTSFDSLRSEDENIMVGWTVGGGLEYQINRWLTAGVEYRHSEFGDDNFSPGGNGAITPRSQDVNLVNDQVTVKVNVLFMNLFRR